jgi:hypothetical protein
MVSRGVTKTKIAEEIGVPPAEIEALLFGLASMLTIDGPGERTPHRNVDLKVVK